MPKRDYYGKFKNSTLASVKAAMSSRSLKKYRKGSRKMSLNRRGVASRETGYVDLASSSYAFSSGANTIALLATVAQGAAVTQRVGKKIKLKSLQCRGYVSNDSAATINDCAFLVIYDKRPTGSLPAVTDILVSADTSSFNNDANSGRFKILKRMDFLLCGAPATTNGDGPAVTCDFYLDLKGLPCVYKAAGTGAIGDIEEGAIYGIWLGSTAAGTSDATAAMAFRTRFIDI